MEPLPPVEELGMIDFWEGFAEFFFFFLVNLCLKDEKSSKIFLNSCWKDLKHPDVQAQTAGLWLKWSLSMPMLKFYALQ